MTRSSPICADYVRERLVGQTLFLNHNINLINIREVEGMIETAHDLGVDGILLNLTEPCEGVDGIRPYLIGDDTALLFAKAHKKAVTRAAQLGVSLRFFRNLYGTAPSSWSSRPPDRTVRKLNSRFAASRRRLAARAAPATADSMRASTAR